MIYTYIIKIICYDTISYDHLSHILPVTFKKTICIYITYIYDMYSNMCNILYNILHVYIYISLYIIYTYTIQDIPYTSLHRRTL